jgi:hypothetical protein
MAKVYECSKCSKFGKCNHLRPRCDGFENKSRNGDFKMRKVVIGKTKVYVNDAKEDKVYIIKTVRRSANHHSYNIISYCKICKDYKDYFYASYLNNSNTGTYGYRSKDLVEALKYFLRNDHCVDFYEVYEFDNFEEFCKWYLDLPEDERMRK